MSIISDPLARYDLDSPKLSQYDFNTIFQLRSGNLIDRGIIENTVGITSFWQDPQRCQKFLRKFPAYLFFAKYEPKSMTEEALAFVDDRRFVDRSNRENFELLVESKYPHEWETVTNYIKKSYRAHLGIPEPKQKVITDPGNKEKRLQILHEVEAREKEILKSVGIHDISQREMAKRLSRKISFYKESTILRILKGF